MPEFREFERMSTTVLEAYLGPLVVAVHPNHRGRGLAKALLSTGIRRIKHQGATNISIGVDAVNTPAVQLYLKYGSEIKSRLSFFSSSRPD